MSKRIALLFLGLVFTALGAFAQEKDAEVTLLQGENPSMVVNQVTGSRNLRDVIIGSLGAYRQKLEPEYKKLQPGTIIRVPASRVDAAKLAKRLELEKRAPAQLAQNKSLNRRALRRLSSGCYDGTGKLLDCGKSAKVEPKLPVVVPDRVLSTEPEKSLKIHLGGEVSVVVIPRLVEEPPESLKARVDCIAGQKREILLIWKEAPPPLHVESLKYERGRFVRLTEDFTHAPPPADPHREPGLIKVTDSRGTRVVVGQPAVVQASYSSSHRYRWIGEVRFMSH